jgi:cell wall-associated NlpC family hydrolase
LTAALGLLALALVLTLGGVPDMGATRPGTHVLGSARNTTARGAIPPRYGVAGVSSLSGASGTRTIARPALVAPAVVPTAITAPPVAVPQSKSAVAQDSAGMAGGSLVGTTTDDGINVREGPGADYRIVAQLPVNTRASVLAEQPGWYHIHTLSQTDGWVAAEFLKVGRQPPGDAQLQAIGSAGVVGVVNLRAGPGTNFPTIEQLTDGSVLEVLALQGDWYKVRSPLGTTGWVAAENIPLDWIPDIYGGSSAPTGGSSSQVVSIAQKYLGARYIWGGSDPTGFDCSGLTWYVYEQIGVELPAGSAEQFSTDYGQFIGSIDALTPGDLVFFERTTDEEGITHVGIYAGDGKMIAARSERLGVRYVSLSDPFWSNRFVGGIRPYR